MQALLAGLLSTYEFSIDPKLDVYRAQIGTMVPVIRGQEEKRMQMPLKVKLISRV